MKGKENEREGGERKEKQKGVLKDTILGAGGREVEGERVKARHKSRNERE